jgi:L-asparagine oxygenase
LARLAEGLTANPSKEAERFCAQAAAAAEQLPASVTGAIAGFGRDGSEEGVLLVEGLPLDDEPPATPPDNTEHLGETTVTARAQAILNHALGEMVAYEAEGEGALFQDMVPKRAAAGRQTSLSSRGELELHTEQAFSDLRPDWLSLACLRGAPDAKTYVMTARDVVAMFDRPELDLLREPLWMTGVDESFRTNGHALAAGDLRGPVAVLEGVAADPLIRFDQDLDRGITPEASALTEHIVGEYPTSRRAHVLEAGQLLFVDNRRAVHGRSPFAARFDGSDRFVIRTFVVRDLARSGHARPGGGRIVAARFS